MFPMIIALLLATTIGTSVKFDAKPCQAKPSAGCSHPAFK